MAILPASITSGHLYVGHHAWELPKNTDLADGEVRLGVRPDGWLFNQPGGIPFTVRRTERLPAERLTLLRGTIGSTEVTIAADASYPGSTETTITPDPAGMYMFDLDGAARHTPGVPDLF